jgi:hypothetical protein
LRTRSVASPATATTSNPASSSTLTMPVRINGSSSATTTRTGAAALTRLGYIQRRAGVLSPAPGGANPRQRVPCAGWPRHRAKRRLQLMPRRCRSGEARERDLRGRCGHSDGGAMTETACPRHFVSAGNGRTPTTNKACGHTRHVGSCPWCQRSQLARWAVQLAEALPLRRRR